MSLNLQPGQILSNSIYQPTQPSHFPPEFSRGAHPPSHGIRAPRGPVELTTAGHETATTGPPLRRNQTLPAASLAYSPPGQSYQVSPPVTSEVIPYQRPYPTDSNVHQPNPPPYRPVDSVPSRSSGRRRTSQMSRHPSELPYASPPSHSYPSQSAGVDYDTTRHSPYVNTSNTGPPSQIAPVPSIAPPETPTTPVLEQRFSHTLYLTNPDETTGTFDHRTHGPPLPTAPEMVHPSGERRSDRPRRSHHASLYGGQPTAGTRLTDSENRRRSAPRGSPPNAAPTSEQDSPRRYELPSQTVAAINAQYVGKAPSTSSSSRTSSSLAPRHVPKRLVMPTPLARTAESPSPMPPAAAAFSRANTGRPGQVLRKRDPRGSMHQPQRTQSFPPQTVKSGIFSMFKFGKGSKSVVREVRMMEQPKVEMSEKGQRRVRIREEPRKLSKRR
jgi:hypothetical protein